MPYGKRIGDADRSIDEIQTRIAKLRQIRGGSAQIDRLLGRLAKLKAERSRLMLHQSLWAKRQKARPTSAELSD